MVRLSAHSLCADATSCSSRAAPSLSSAKVAAGSHFRSFRERRVRTSFRQSAVLCNLESKLDNTGARKNRGLGLQCSPVAAAEAAPPSSVEDLERQFGQPGLKFVEAAGYRIVEMRLKEGSSARIELQSALVTSYKSRMWHGGVEELLHAVVVPGADASHRPRLVGGVALRVWESEGERDANLAATESWDVEYVRSDPANFVQVW